MRRMLRRFRDQSGANLIEAAIITPLLLLLTFSIVDFGSLFYVYLALENGVSEATRFGVTGNTMTDPSGNAMTRQDSLMAAMRDATPTVTIPDSAFTFEHMSPGSSTWVAGTGQPNDIERLTVGYDWQLLTPLISPFFTGGAIHLQVQSAMKNEGRFQ
jgi:Flp pilus assembly protein TadG